MNIKKISAAGNQYCQRYKQDRVDNPAEPGPVRFYYKVIHSGHTGQNT